MAAAIIKPPKLAAARAIVRRGSLWQAVNQAFGSARGAALAMACAKVSGKSGPERADFRAAARLPIPGNTVMVPALGWGVAKW